MAEPREYTKRKTVRKPFEQTKYNRNESRQLSPTINTGSPTIQPTGGSATQQAGNVVSKMTQPTGSTGGAYSGAAARTQPAEGDKWDGWAGKNFVPGERDLLFSSPDTIVRKWLSEGPYKGNQQMAGDMSRYANIMFGDEQNGGLYELMTAGSLNPKATGDDDMINALHALLGEQSKVGGRSPSVEGMLKMLYEGFNDPKSTMGGLMKTGSGDDATTGQAINSIMQFIPLLGEFTGNRRYSDAMYRQATQLAQQYIDKQVTGGNKGSFLDFFQSNYMR